VGAWWQWMLFQIRGQAAAPWWMEATFRDQALDDALRLPLDRVNLGDRFAAVGDRDRFALADAAEVAAGVLPEFADADREGHVSTCSTFWGDLVARAVRRPGYD
jgi:hypothetical protein